MANKGYELRKLDKLCQDSIKNKDFTQLIIYYEKIFNLTKDYHFKQKVANIHYQIFHDIAKAAEIYKEILPYLRNESLFWWQYFEIQANLNRTYEAVSCVYNAINIEIKGVKKEKNA